MSGIDISVRGTTAADDKVVTCLMIEYSRPPWSGEGWDAAAGGFVERLDPDARADRPEPRRVRVQERQICSFAKAARMGWYPMATAVHWLTTFRRPHSITFCAPLLNQEAFSADSSATSKRSHQQAMLQPLLDRTNF